MGTGDTVGLTFGGLNHEVDAAVVGEGLVQLEGGGVTLADDGSGGGILHAQEGGRYENRLAAAGDDPVVQAAYGYDGIKVIILDFLVRCASGATLCGN